MFCFVYYALLTNNIMGVHNILLIFFKLRKMIPLHNNSQGYSHINDSPEKGILLETQTNCDYSTRVSPETVDISIKQLTQAFVNNILNINNTNSINHS